MADINEIISKEAIADLEKTEAIIIRLNDELLKMGKTSEASINIISKSSEGAAAKSQKLSDVEKEQAKVLADLDKQRQSALRSMGKQEAKEREMADALNKEARSVADLNKQNRALVQARNSTDASTDKGKKKIEEYNKRINDNNIKIKENVSALEKQKLGIGAYGDGILEALSRMSPLTASVSNATKSMVSYTGATKGAAAANEVAAVSANVGTKAMKILKIALISTGIGALIVAVGALYAYFVKTERGAMKLREIMAQFKAVINVLIDRVIMLGEGLYKIFTGKFKSGWTEMKDAFKDIGTEIQNDVRASRELAQEQNKLILLRRSSNEKIAENELLIAKNIETAKDLTATIADRKKAYDIIDKATRENIKLTEDINKQEIANLEGQLELAENTGEVEEQLSQAKIKATKEQETRYRKTIELLEISRSIDTQIANEEKARTPIIEINTRAYEDQLDVLDEILVNDKDVGKEAEKAADEWIESWERAHDLLNEINSRGNKSRLQVIEDEKKALDKALSEGLISQAEYNEALGKLRAESADAYLELSQNVAASINGFSNQLFEAQQIRDENARANEIKAAGDNKEKIAKINEKYDKKERELKIKKAKTDKTFAIFDATINLARAVVAALTAGPGIGIALAAITAVLAGLQLAAIIATPIPQYAKGTRSAKRGAAWIGEKGKELIVGKDGRLSLSPSTASLVNLKGGERIIPNRETELLLRAAKGADDGTARAMMNQMHEDNVRLVQTIKDKTELHIYDGGRKVTERKGSYYRHYFNKKIAQ